MCYNGEDSFQGDVWDADTGALEGKYEDVLGASTTQTIRRANSEARCGFFENKRAYHDEANTSVMEPPEPPGSHRNEDDRHVLKDVLQKDTHTPLSGATAPDLRWSLGNPVRQTQQPEKSSPTRIVGGSN